MFHSVKHIPDSISTQELFNAAQAYHYVLYERVAPFITPEIEKEIFDKIMSELRRRGYDLAWAGIQG